MKKEDCSCKENCNMNSCMWYRADLICPCSNCLIKMMCVEGCDAYNEYVKKVLGLFYEYMRKDKRGK